MVNSLSGFEYDPGMAGTVKRFGCPIIIYHIKGRPRTMQEGAIEYGDVVGEIRGFFRSQMEFAEWKGVRKAQLLIDPGIGFGKTLGQNLEIIRGLGRFSGLGLPIAVGVSRKSHLGALLREELGLESQPGPMERLEAALAETAVAVMNGARLIRTHDVLTTRRFVAALDALNRKGGRI
jgi:dihydropteroate synthase